MAGLHSIAARYLPVDPRSVREIEQEIEEELNFHVEMRAAENIRRGLDPEVAMAAARSSFGNFEHIRRSCRNALAGERIMLQRLQTLLILVLLLAVIALGYQSSQMISVQRTNETALAEMSQQLARLEKSSATDTAPAWAADRPRVVDTFPVSGAADVDPATDQIRVTFDKPMADGNWSWVQISADTFPESAGDIHYTDDLTTCVMPVKLKPGTRYVIWLNSAKFQNFKDPEGRPAVPHLLTFTTRE